MSSQSKEKSNLILCDAWYGFPSQKGPRKERICAVSRQLFNFLHWKHEAKLLSKECKVHLLGKDSDIGAIQDRMGEIAAEKSKEKIKYSSQIEFKSNVDIREAIQQWKQKDGDEKEVYYLSPDATETLSCTSRPPSAVVVGMLIDRRITSDRSKKRAEESLHLQPVKLPLDELKVKGICSEEPLNIDTVMELMLRWWNSCDKLEEQLEKAGASQYRKCFVEAAAWAMKSHRDRHPNRTVHKT